DPGFWLFKEYFNLTIGETIKSWSVLETIISVCGLVGCLLLGMATPVNIPGTSTEYPNWRRKLSVTLEQMFADERVNKLIKDLD
uniref:GntT/GntP/DsdX family permease n=1 Tax=Klebsiella pneumoniae TaxID=573 RepID=UPI0040451781